MSSRGSSFATAVTTEAGQSIVELNWTLNQDQSTFPQMLLGNCVHFLLKTHWSSVTCAKRKSSWEKVEFKRLMSINCQRRLTCQICNSHHVTALHIDRKENQMNQKLPCLNQKNHHCPVLYFPWTGSKDCSSSESKVTKEGK